MKDDMKRGMKRKSGNVGVSVREGVRSEGEAQGEGKVKKYPLVCKMCNCMIELTNDGLLWLSLGRYSDVKLKIEIRENESICLGCKTFFVYTGLWPSLFVPHVQADCRNTEQEKQS